MAGLPMTLGNPQEQRNDAIFKAAVVYNASLQISILQQGPSPDTREYLSQYFPSQPFS